MTRRGLGWLGVGLLAGAGAGLLDLASALNPAVGFADDTALIMGYAGTSDPNDTYVNNVMDVFINPATKAFTTQPVYPGYAPVVQSTPEGADYQQVLSQGSLQLDQGITQQLDEGHKVLVYGYSESTSIATQEMVNLAALPADQRPDPADLQFMLVEDLNNPDGGFINRMPYLSTFEFPATPADTAYHTTIYTIEYSGSSDFPKYPLDLLADANAEAGFIDLHPFLLPGWPTGFSSSELAGAVLQPTSAGYDGVTQYFMIPTQDLPILDGLRSVPGIGPAMADMMQPDMRVIIDLGYDRTDPADVITPAVWTMPNIDWTTVNAELALGAQQGWTAAMVDLGQLPASDLPNAYPYLPDIAGLQSGSVAAAASTLPAAGEISGLFGSQALTDAAHSLSADLLSSLSGLFTNPFDFGSF